MQLSAAMKAKHPLLAYREGNNLSLDALAAQLKVNKSTVLRWETGEVPLPIARLSIVEKLTGIPREKLRPDIFDPVQSRGAA